MDTFRSPAIGDAAPHFQAETTFGRISFPEDYKGKWVILFSYYGDFSPVCATELMELAAAAKEFASNDCGLLGLSVDSAASHIQWTRAMERYRWKNAAKPDFSFPLIADDHGEVSRLYGILPTGPSAGRTARHVFYIDPGGVLRAVLAYPIVAGRNTHEMLRLLLALQTVDATGYYTPGNWVPGDDLVYSAPQTSAGAQKTVEELRGSSCIDWYLCFAKDASRAPKPGSSMESKPSAPTADQRQMTGQQPLIVQPQMTGQPLLAVQPQVVGQPQLPKQQPPQQPAPGSQSSRRLPQMPEPGRQSSPPPQVRSGGQQTAVQPQTPGRASPQPREQARTGREREFTQEELARYTGQGNMPALGAVNGVVYDLTPIIRMPVHMGLKPGTDLTEEFGTCHMGMSYLLGSLTPVGRLVMRIPGPAAVPVPAPSAAPRPEQPPSASVPADADPAHDYIILRDSPFGTPVV